MLEVKFYRDVEDRLLKFAVIVARHNGKWVFCRHKERNTYECPGGHREPGEAIERTARRELYEETGADEYELRPVCAYSVRECGGEGPETFGMLYYAEVARFGELPAGFEMEKVVLFEELPDCWTYPEIQPRLIEQVRTAMGFTRAIPDTAVTHGGRFHADDVFSSALLRILKPGIKIRRMFAVPEGFDGLAFDLGLGEFDHHQADAAVRENGVPYAAFGLLWGEFGASLVGEDEAARFDEKFIQPLDEDDNRGTGNAVAGIIGAFNPAWDSGRPADDCFDEAVAFARVILEKKFEDIRGIQRARALVEAALARAEDGIVVLERFSPWKMVLRHSDALFVIYPSQRGGYNAQAIPKEDSEELKIPFPKEWTGRPAGELPGVSGVPTLRFCHNSGFLVSADTQEDARRACLLARAAARGE